MAQTADARALPRGSDPTLRRLPRLALAGGVALACTDVATSLLDAPAGLADPAHVGGPLLAGIVGFGLGLAVALAAGVAAARALRVGRPAALAVALGVAGAATVALSTGLGRIPHRAADLGPLVALVAAALWAAVPVYLGAARAAGTPAAADALLARAALAGPALGGLALVSAWGAAFHPAAGGRAWLFAAGVAGIGGLVALARWRAAPWRAATALALALVLAAAAGTAVTVRREQRIAVEASPGGVAPPDARSVLLVSVDTLRADALSVYGGPTPTPAFERLARDGVVFEAARTPSPWTKPSVVSLVTGLAPMVHGAVGRWNRVPDAIHTLAERFRDAGYATAGIVGNHYLGSDFAFDQGFGRYDAFPRPSFGRSWGAILARRLFGAAFVEVATTADLTDRAIRFVRTHADRPFFLWLHYYDPHVPYEPPARDAPPGDPPPGVGRTFDAQWDIRTGHFAPDADQRRWIRALYQGEVRYVDRELGRLLDALEGEGIYDRSGVVLTSDHGEEFWEHDGFEHGHSVFDEVLRVPLIVKWPGVESRRVADPVEMTSVAPTVIDLADLPGDRARLSAPSLAPLLGASETGPEDPAPLPWVATDVLYGEDQVTLLLDGYKWIRRLASGRESLYDLRRDPTERHDVIDAHPELAARARAELAELERRAAEARRAAGLTSSEAAPDAETVRRLRALGYVQ